jgi:hypothetical protein
MHATFPVHLIDVGFITLISECQWNLHLEQQQGNTIHCGRPEKSKKDLLLRNKVRKHMIHLTSSIVQFWTWNFTFS